MIELVGDYLQRYLVVLLAVVLVPFKIIVIRLCRDAEGEAGAILSVPEDLCYVALGLILSDLLNPSGALRRHFRSSPHAQIDIAIVIAINVIVAVLVHMISRQANRAYMRWRGSSESRESLEPVQGEFAFQATADEDALHLVTHHLSTLAMLYGTQLIVVIFWLHWLAKIISNVQN